MSVSKLRWRCRRGTRELDVILTRFLDQTYPHLSVSEQALFASLLDQQDPDLAAWIWGGVTPPERWAGLIARIREGLVDGD
ncbi:MAG: succinate dehydrogenase assembly factor 2 [Gammaproteobacteria bacterium]|nr:succinate dehydrogenase assembly factor 2 [Gammaproteobacteria bacterium]